MNTVRKNKILIIMFQILNYQYFLKQKKGVEYLKRKNLIKLRADLGLKSQEFATLEPIVLANACIELLHFEL